MNPTGENAIPSVEEALRAGNEYAERARQRVSNGAKTDRFEQGAQEYSQNEDKLHGDTPPGQAINTEKPQHVLMCYMLASGKSIKEIAEATGHSEGGVRLITRQPWFRKRFLRLTSEAGKNQVESFLAMETLSSLEVLVQVRDDNVKSRPHVSVAAANSILDRALGKPTQKVESENHNYNHKAAESGSELDRQIRQTEEQLKALGHNHPDTGAN